MTWRYTARTVAASFGARSPRRAGRRRRRRRPDTRGSGRRRRRRRRNRRRPRPPTRQRTPRQRGHRAGRHRGATEPSRRRTSTRRASITDVGVDDTTIKIGLQRRPVGHLRPARSHQIVDGQEAYWEIVNDNGGIGGRQIEPVVLDNVYDVPHALENYEEMSGDGAEGVVMFSRSDGSPHTTATADAWSRTT